MPKLSHYTEFSGRHLETGSLHNSLAYQGFKAPHTNQPYSEALLLGVSGGIAFGYFTFDYEGYDPILALLPRNTFDPMPTIYERLGIAHDVIQSVDSAKAETNLNKALDSGHAPLVWADLMSLPYTATLPDANNWLVQPIVVYGLENGVASIADRAHCGWEVTSEELRQARARVKKDKNRLITFEAPQADKLPSAVQKGIWQCISLFTENPPKGAKHNFGFAAYTHWAEMLVNTRNKQSWERFFPSGRRMIAALVSSYNWVMHFWVTQAGADRDTYADFLGEAAQTLNKPTLAEVGNAFRTSGELWRDLATTMLEPLPQIRTLLERNYQLFMENGMNSIEERLSIQHQLEALKDDPFPLTPTETVQFRENLSAKIMKIHDVEKEAITALQSAMM